MAIKQDNIYRKLSRMNPRFCEHATSMILRAYIAPVNRVLKKASVFRLEIPHLGIIKTHGNRKKKVNKNRKKYQRKYHKKRNAKMNWLDSELLK